MAKDSIPSPHPLTPPHSEEDVVSRLRLLRSRRVGPATYRRLIAAHGSAAAALAALPEVALQAGVSDYQPCSEAEAVSELRAGRLAGAVLVHCGEPGYPPLLAETADAPPMLWVLGQTDILGRDMIALIGARNASSLGTRMARSLARELGEHGYIVVSGLARGIDAAAHLAAADTGTVAVMAGGVDVIYPAEHAALGQEILDHGARVSEQPPGLPPRAKHFPQRNRIIAGMARATIVVEAAARSGSLLTARAALDAGRDVLAVPGHPFDARAWGCNSLIRDGAALVRNAEDVIEALRPPAPPPATQTEMTLATDAPRPAERDPAETRALHALILERLGPSPLAEDQLIRDLQLAAGEVCAELTALEVEGQIRRQAGGLVSLA